MGMSAYDRWATSEPPDDGLDCFTEDVTETFSESFYENNEEWILNGEQCNKWIEKCYYYKDINPKATAALIERAFRKYKL